MIIRCSHARHAALATGLLAPNDPLREFEHLDDLGTFDGAPMPLMRCERCTHDADAETASGGVPAARGLYLSKVAEAQKAERKRLAELEAEPAPVER